MAAALAAKLPAPAPVQQSAPQPQVTKVPQRMEGVVDPEATREVESVQASSLVCLPAMRSTARLSGRANHIHGRIGILTIRAGVPEDHEALDRRAASTPSIVISAGQAGAPDDKSVFEAGRDRCLARTGPGGRDGGGGLLCPARRRDFFWTCVAL